MYICIYTHEGAGITITIIRRGRGIFELAELGPQSSGGIGMSLGDFIDDRTGSTGITFSRALHPPPEP